MVSAKKKQTMKEVDAQLKEYPVVGLLNMHKLPGRQLHEIRNKLRGQAVIRMVKKALIVRLLKKRGLEGLDAHIQGEPAFFRTKEDPFKMAKVLQRSKSPTMAKAGDIAPRDIVIPAGITNLTPGPVIGELQRVKIPAGVEGEKIVIKKDTTIVKEGEEISADVAGILSKLEIQPMEIGLNLVAVWENGIVYEKSILFVPDDYYLNELQIAASHALNLSVAVGYATPESMPLLIVKAHREAETLAVEAGIMNSGTIGRLLAKAKAEAAALEPK